ncbi:MAG: class I SAM-dependent methyltransferase [Phycisphaerales bacterium]|nr:class I SAM-dependent methyltransferase [Phycisphaerales bacterium]
MNPWQQFFDRYAENYDDEVFTKNTDAEVEFILQQTTLPAGSAFLDLGCGTGRHSIPLAQRGYRVTGVDFSAGMLAVAAQRAQRVGVEVELVLSNVKDFVRCAAFDAVICLCEGALCLLNNNEDPLRHDLVILHNIHTALRPGGVVILNVLSALRAARAATEQSIHDGRFDPLTMTEQSDVHDLLPDLPAAERMRERYYTAPELRRMAEDAGLRVAGIYGGTAGNWGLRPIRLDDYELMLIATK